MSNSLPHPWYPNIRVLLDIDDPQDDVGTMIALNTITGTQTGKILLGSINALGKKMDIRPYPSGMIVNIIERMTGRSSLNALTYPTNERNASMKYRPILNSKDGSPPEQSDTDRRKLAPILFGTGLGSDVEVFFSPKMWATVSQKCNNVLPGNAIPEQPCGAGALADEVLFHEMVHGLRQMMGIRHCAAMDGGYETFEEFVAVVVANIYISAKDGNEGLRANHQSFAALQDPSHFSDDPENRRNLERIHKEQPDLVKQLATKVNAPSNPFRDLYGSQYSQKIKIAP